MYIYHALVNVLSAHMIHINLNMIFYTHVEHSPTKTIYIKYYTEKQTNTRTIHTLDTHARTHTHTHTVTVCEISMGLEVLKSENYGKKGKNTPHHPPESYCLFVCMLLF